MWLSWVVMAVVLIFGLAALVYAVAKATMFKETAEALQHELKQFKEGGFDRLISDKLSLFTAQASKELEQREKLIREIKTEVLEEERKAATAAEQFKEDFGAVQTQISGLRDLQTTVAELNDLLKPQQYRGEVGEVIVRTLLADKLPQGQFEENHTFPDGKQVEFAIRLNDRLIPVDAKLPLDDYKRMCEAIDDRQRQACRSEFKRTVKKKIDEVKEYIQPDDGTYNFALMIIPSEAVYYDLIANKDFLETGGLSEYALARNIFLMSPNTFWAYLTAIAHGLRGLEIERHTEQILTNLQTLSTKIRGFAQDEFRKLGGHLKNAGNSYDEADRKLRDIDAGLSSLERVEAEQVNQRGAVS